MNVKGYDEKERFEFGVITSFAYPIENSGESNSGSSLTACCMSTIGSDHHYRGEDHRGHDSSGNDVGR